MFAQDYKKCPLKDGNRDWSPKGCPTYLGWTQSWTTAAAWTMTNKLADLEKTGTIGIKTFNFTLPTSPTPRPELSFYLW